MIPKWCSGVSWEHLNLSEEKILHPWLILCYLAISSDEKSSYAGFTEVCINAKLCLDGHEVEKINV